MLDAETVLRQSRRPLVIGMGGGGDVVGALATAELGRRYDGSEPILGGLAWERRPIDPLPGPRNPEEIEHGEEVAPGVMLASAQTRVRDREVYFAESRMAEFLGEPTVLITLDQGPATIASSLDQVARELERDLLVFIDVGGDVLAQGHEPGLRSPLGDAIMLAVAARLLEAGHPVLGGIFGIGCDGELTPGEVLDALSELAGAGGLAGARGLTDPVARRLEEAIRLIPTEASAHAVSAFRNPAGTAPIRGGVRSIERTAAASVTFYFDVSVAYERLGRLAQAVNGAADLEEANDALHALGVHSELDLEREAVKLAAG
ncbi:MAG TPA: DUF1152 domain-containing protein [Solirubrobacteraceae bacterium]|jgi:hypothetical protein